MCYKWKAKILTHFHSFCHLPTLCSHIKLSQSLPHIKMSSSINIPCQIMRTDDRRKGSFSTELLNRWISAFHFSFRIGLTLSGKSCFMQILVHVIVTFLKSHSMEAGDEYLSHWTSPQHNPDLKQHGNFPWKFPEREGMEDQLGCSIWHNSLLENSSMV